MCIFTSKGAKWWQNRDIQGEYTVSAADVPEKAGQSQSSVQNEDPGVCS